SPSGVFINELYVDRALQGDSVEWVEIAGPFQTALGGLRLRHYRFDDPGVTLVFDLPLGDAGDQIPSSGLWTVGGLMSEAMNRTYAIGAPDHFGLDGTGGMLQLYRASDGVLLDAVGYGTARSVDAPSAPTTTMFGSAAPLPAGGEKNQSLARRPGASAHDNAADYCLQAPSANAPNGDACL
ncbi:MAG: hypothetical protein OZ921_15115, partial [Sorangiineae bacterium]|nr:hypothetical protein [Sorangiineae bacterium]